MLYPQGEYYLSGSTTVNAVLCLSASTFLYVDSLNTLYQMDYGFQVINSLALSGNVASIVLCGTSSAVLNYTGTSRFDVINLSNLTRAGITTNANASRSIGPHQLAANTTTNYACATHTSASRFHIINCVAGTATVYNPTFLTTGSQNVNCVCTKDSNFILGTDIGNIYEVDTSGTLVAGYSLPRTPNNGTSPTSYGISALAYSNGQLLASTTRGVIYTLQHSASSVLSDGEFLGGDVLYPTDTSFISFSNVVSGSCFGNMPGISNAGSYKPIPVFWIGNSNPTVANNIFTENTSNIIYSSVSPGSEYFVAACSVSSNSAFRVKVFRFLDPLVYDFTSTRIQYPLGVDISGNILRLKDGGIGNVVIDLDQSVPAGVTNLPAAKWNSYIELALDGAASSVELWDVRQFTG